MADAGQQACRRLTPDQKLLAANAAAPELMSPWIRPNKLRDFFRREDARSWEHWRQQQPAVPFGERACARSHDAAPSMPATGCECDRCFYFLMAILHKAGKDAVRPGVLVGPPIVGGITHFLVLLHYWIMVISNVVIE